MFMVAKSPFCVSQIDCTHNDLRTFPSQLLSGWSSDGVLKLFDFGLSVSVRAQRDRTEQYRYSVVILLLRFRSFTCRNYFFIFSDAALLLLVFHMQK